MAKKESKLPGDKKTKIQDVVKEEMDPEGLPVIDRTEEQQENSQSAIRNPELAIRVMAVKTYLKHPNGIFRAHFQNELITDPWPELIEAAKADKKGNTLRIVIKKG